MTYSVQVEPLQPQCIRSVLKTSYLTDTVIHFSKTIIQQMVGVS